MKNNKNIIILSIIFLIVSIFLYAKIGNMLIDFSREIYIPFQINNNEKLIKDIFLIYGPFGYIINALFYKISPNINFLLLESHIISYCILILFYLITNYFFNSKVSLTLSVFFIGISIFSNSTFSFVLPYSYSTLWAVFGVYLTLASILYNKNKILFLSLGLILCSKIELFTLTTVIIAIYFFYTKKPFRKNILYISIFPSICLIFFLFNSINYSDIINNLFYISKMAQTNAIAYLYKGLGCFFEINYFKYNLILCIKFITICSISYLFFKIEKPTISYLIFILLLKFTDVNYIFNLGLIFAILITIINLKNKQITKEEMILFGFSFILCSKSIFAINSINYANFGYFLVIIYLFLQLQKIFNKKWMINILIIFFIFNLTTNFAYYIKNPKEKIKTKIGNLYISKNESILFKKTNLYIEKHIKNDENFIVVPEGQIFNLIHKKPYKFYNSTFTPLDFETFGENNIIKKLKQNKTDYIIFYPRNTYDYGAQTICYDYGVDFCLYIIDNYNKIDAIEENSKVLIFKIKK